MEPDLIGQEKKVPGLLSELMSRASMEPDLIGQEKQQIGGRHWALHPPQWSLTL